ncbi:hypothetical protein OBK08_05685 [Empedobacter falsenii]
MIIFDFVAYKVYKMVKKGRQYEGVEKIATAFLLAFPVTILVSTIINNMGKIYNLNIVDFLYKFGRLPFFIVFTIPMMLVIALYLNKISVDIEYRISTNSILKKMDKIPNLIIYFLFGILNFILSVIINEFTIKYLI